MKNEEITKDVLGRYCEHCKREHAIFYLCKHYSKKTKNEIKEQIEKWRNQLDDIDWAVDQVLKKHKPLDYIAMHRTFAGFDDLSTSKFIRKIVFKIMQKNPLE